MNEKYIHYLHASLEAYENNTDPSITYFYSRPSSNESALGRSNKNQF